MADMAVRLQALDAADRISEPSRGLDDGVSDQDVEGAGRQLRQLLNEGDRPDPVGAAPELREDGTPLKSLGEAILRQMEDISRNYREQKKQMVASIDEQTGAGNHRNGPPQDGKSVFQLMSLQMQLAETSLEVELISKGVSKFVSTVDQLSKLQ